MENYLSSNPISLCYFIIVRLSAISRCRIIVTGCFTAHEIEHKVSKLVDLIVVANHWIELDVHFDKIAKIQWNLSDSKRTVIII